MKYLTLFVLFYCRKLLGQGLESSTLDELQQVEGQLERSLSNIRARKVQNVLSLSIYLEKNNL